MKRLCAAVVLVGSLLAGRGQSTDEFYVRIYNTIQEADALAGALQYAPALEKYSEARTALDRLQRGNPGWNAAIVKFRLAYLGERMAEIQPKIPGPRADAPATGEAPAGAAASGAGVAPALEAQVNALQEQLRVLEADRDKLEARLKEALSVQPAAVDPRELAKAEQRVQTLQKENDLLKVNIERERTRAAQPAVQAEALADLNRRVSAQTDRVQALELEKKALEERLKAASADVEAAAALRAENELLKKRLAASKGKSGVAAVPAPKGPESVTQAEKQLAALKSDKEILLLEKQALQGRVRQLQVETTNAVAVSLPPAPPTREEARRIRELEKERESLFKKLNAANKGLEGRKGGSARVRELQSELSSLRQRLSILEAEKVPHTEEELFLFRAPDPTFAAPGSKDGPPPRKFSANTASMAADAQRDFSAGRLDEAEQKFQRVLAENKTDVVTLANLATVQIARKQHAEAEANIKRAMDLAPRDAFTISLLGRLRFEQGRHDDAFEALSRAADLDPKSAEIQNYLGLVLSEKGMRTAAETALRKALQLQPNYGSAHQNLAVVYLTANPPLVELARHHYSKSLAGGAPRNEQLEKLIESKRAIQR